MVVVTDSDVHARFAFNSYTRGAASCLAAHGPLAQARHSWGTVHGCRVLNALRACHTDWTNQASMANPVVPPLPMALGRAVC